MTLYQISSHSDSQSSSLYSYALRTHLPKSQSTPSLCTISYLTQLSLIRCYSDLFINFGINSSLV